MITTDNNVLDHTEVQTVETFSHKTVVVQVMFSMTQTPDHCAKKTFNYVIYTTDKVGIIELVEK